jgi:AcrR family transcriptional regulator
VRELATRRLTAQARRAQLLEVAREVFAADGYHGAGMEQIAVRAGVTKPVLYQHFESKKELYLGLLDEDMARLLEDIGRAIEGARSNRERIERATGAYFGFIDSNEGSFRLLFRETMGAEDEFRKAIERFRDELARRITAVIQSETGLPPGEAELLARGVMGIAESAAQWWLDHRSVPAERVVRDLSELAWRGLAGLPRRGE